MAQRRASLRIPGTIANELGLEIIAGKRKPGSVLDGEVTASVERRVSRSAYREAMRILIAKGLVVSRPRMGTRVSPVADWHLLDPDVLGWIFASQPTGEMVNGLFELRRIVEPEVAALAAKRRSRGELRSMAAALAGMAEHGLETEQGRLADQEFHAALLSASGNAFLISLTTGIGAAVVWSTQFKHQRQPLRYDAVFEHQRVYRAVLERNPAAAYAAMRELIEMAFKTTARARARMVRAGKKKIAKPRR